MTFQDHRDIPLDVLRDFVRSQTERTSIRQAAVEAGVGRTTLHAFVYAVTKPHPRVLRVLGLWYIAKQNEAPDVDVVRPYAAALAVLLSGIPAYEQDAARTDAIAALQCIYEGRAPLPRWLALLSGEVGR